MKRKLFKLAAACTVAGAVAIGLFCFSNKAEAQYPGQGNCFTYVQITPTYMPGKYVNNCRTCSMQWTNTWAGQSWCGGVIGY